MFHNYLEINMKLFVPGIIKFSQDQIKFHLSLFRAYDIAASTKGVKVFLNGRRLPVKSFKDYVDQYIKVNPGVKIHPPFF